EGDPRSDHTPLRRAVAKRMSCRYSASWRDLPWRLPPPVGWVSVHPEITPPDNFYHFRDTTKLRGRIRSPSQPSSRLCAGLVTGVFFRTQIARSEWSRNRRDELCVLADARIWCS